MAVLEVQHLEKRFGSTRVLEDIGFSLEKGRALAILGSSGSGKTTLLRCLNFLETPNGGRILVNGETVFDAADPATQRESEVRTKRLHFGLVFQAFHLFPQYTALENVTLAASLLAQERGASREDLPAIRHEGMELPRPLFEMCYKDDALGDPFIIEDHALLFGWATKEELDKIKDISLRVNAILKDYFAKLGVVLVDFKLEFGKDMQGNLILADEISPDTCRFWDKSTGDHLDKDRFRKDLGNVLGAYEEIWRRISA